MATVTNIALKLLAALFFLLAVAAILGALFQRAESGATPGVFLAVVLGGVGRWLWGKSQGHSAKQVFEWAIEVTGEDGDGIPRSRQRH